MTADQLRLDDCEPNWRDNPDEHNALCDLGAEQLHNPSGPTYWEARRQGLTPKQIRSIQTIKPLRRYL